MHDEGSERGFELIISDKLSFLWAFFWQEVVGISVELVAHEKESKLDDAQRKDVGVCCCDTFRRNT